VNLLLKVLIISGNILFIIVICNFIYNRFKLKQVKYYNFIITKDNGIKINKVLNDNTISKKNILSIKRRLI
jgi:hypothetical protein